MHRRLRSLYICYASLEDPLIEAQVIAYLEGLAGRGHTIHLLTYEPPRSASEERALAAELSRRGIAWHSLRYHKTPSLPATIYDALAGAFVAWRLVRRHGLDAVHARSHVPAATGLIVRRLTGRRLIFDIRGLLGEEYVDAGRWRRGGLPHRVTRWIERAAVDRADGIVTLTERVRSHLFGTSGGDAVVIPCCADLERLAPAPERTDQLRTQLGLEGRRVMIYVGKLTAPYMDREMVEFFSAARELEPALSFLVVTQAPPQSIVAEFQAAAIDPSSYRVSRAAPRELVAYLGLADFAIFFCQPTFARIAMSPTKLGEYLAAGLPVVSGPRIGDVDAILTEHRVGTIVETFSKPAYQAAFAEARRLADDPLARARCRQVARELFSLQEVGIPRYDALYQRLAA